MEKLTIVVSQGHKKSDSYQFSADERKKYQRLRAHPTTLIGYTIVLRKSNGKTETIAYNSLDPIDISIQNTTVFHITRGDSGEKIKFEFELVEI